MPFLAVVGDQVGEMQSRLAAAGIRYRIQHSPSGSRAYIRLESTGTEDGDRKACRFLRLLGEELERRHTDSFRDVKGGAL